MVVVLAVAWPDSTVTVVPAATVTALQAVGTKPVSHVAGALHALVWTLVTVWQVFSALDAVTVLPSKAQGLGSP